jgi:hypothetical protein
MKLFEVESNITQDLVLLLKNQLGRTDSVSRDRAPQSLTYPALANLMNNMGYPGINKDSLKKLYDSSDELKKIIRDPKPPQEDPNSPEAGMIILKTAEEREKDAIGSTGGKGIDAMAKQAANYKPEFS